MTHKFTIAIVGCGLGGSALALLMQNIGFNIAVFEQASSFEKIGAGIHISPNLMYIMEKIGVSKSIEKLGWEPNGFISRDAYSNKTLNYLKLGQEMRDLYGMPYLTIHRGDLHRAMTEKINLNNLHMGKKLIALNEIKNKIELVFNDNSRYEADIVIGADGIFSKVRNAITGTDIQCSSYTGQAVFRGLVELQGLVPQMKHSVNKWFGKDNKFIIGYFLDRNETQFYYVAGFSFPYWPRGISVQPAALHDVLKIFNEFHDVPKSMLSLTKSVTLWPLHERTADSTWNKGRIVLIGDACHPMRPHMMSGASMAIEDAAILVKCLQQYGIDNYSCAFNQYQSYRIERVALVQKLSSTNTWLKKKTDTDWLFKYNAISPELRL
ncbi:FAD-dependent monooxygenase [Providencia huaxiensis]|uniref:FAD-dependent monooxygenase n=1 Tax=Providencia huaxiensis TaxID=2027290 RepID=A0A8I2AP45_9GAMM|nr:NAD(P)/FAD-dependent oxidoreductase [Providencia huaxiensis]MBQ0268031.1 FAD-dependent monooxygenase [Providencia huaxiensis]MBQ0536278.1 FAD-dependent monooxygenase [Providencia huaxiensis]MBQ0590191.1 FAD-dependent monooxygenase [Providencia huaxiensis]MCG9534741.1 FAD-dependent monooxygenase [Providencia huaxiensis]MDI7240175.1 NAD(P)/FAD-dependent oxidoreductase [Providencia huaxiensis]